MTGIRNECSVYICINICIERERERENLKDINVLDFLSFPAGLEHVPPSGSWPIIPV